MADGAQFLMQIYSKTDPSNCSGFLKAVAAQLGILGDEQPIPNKDANGIIGFICDHAAQWIKIGRGATDALRAANEASKGYLVVAVVKGPEHADHRQHGHVAVVLPPPLLGNYPRLICAGSAQGRSNGSKSVYVSGNLSQSVWGPRDAPNVRYYRTANMFLDLTP